MLVDTCKCPADGVSHPCMPAILLVPSDSPTPIFFPLRLRLSAHHLALAVLALQPLKSGTVSLHLHLAVLALQPLKSGTVSLHLSVPVPDLIPSVVTSTLTTASRPSNPPNLFLLASQIRLLLTTVRVYILYLFIYLLTQLLTTFTLSNRQMTRSH